MARKTIASLMLSVIMIKKTIILSFSIILLLSIGLSNNCYPADAPCKENSKIDKAELVLVNGKIWTADDNNPYAEAVAIRGDKIIAVGATEQITGYIDNNTMAIDVQNRRVVPGFQDSHTHFLQKAVMANELLGNPYIPVYPEHNELAAILSRGMMAIWQFPIKMLGSTPMDYPTNSTFPSDEVAISRIQFGIQELLKMGITTVFEAGADWEHYEAVARLRDSGALKARFEIYIASRHLDELIERGITREDGDDWLRILGVKFYADGWLGPRTCALRDKYNDTTYPWQLDPNYRGISYMAQEKANRDILKAHKAGLKIATHTIGDMAVEIILNAYENALHEYPMQDHRYTVEHAQVLGQDLIQRIKDLDVIASIQLSFATSDMYFAEKALGTERMKYAYAWKTLLDNGIKCAGGSDYSVETISPLWGIQRIVTRQEINGEPAGGWYPEQCISVEEALRLITINSAYNSFEEDTKGSIEAGKLADLVVLSQDILEIPPNRIADTEVEMTIVGGKIVYQSDNSSL